MGAYREKTVTLMTSADAATLVHLSKLFWGTEVWQVRVNVEHWTQDLGGFLEHLESLWLDLREVKTEANRGPSRRIATLGIMLANCGARLSEHDIPLAASGDPPSSFLTEAKKLIGAKLVEIQVDAPGGDTTFRFDSALSLFCFPASIRERDSWVLETVTGDRVQLGPGSRVTYSSALR
jgi:hypothetical protein